MTAGVKRTTPNLGLTIPTFDTPYWGEYMNGNFDILDGSLTSILGDARYVKKSGDTMTGDFLIQKHSPVFQISKLGTSQAVHFEGLVGLLMRWRIKFGDEAPETGSNVGSDFMIQRFNDAGAFLDNPFFIKRSTGKITINGNPTATNEVANKGYVDAADTALSTGKEPTIASGTTGQYWRGDKSWQTHDKASVGLGSVDNTSDAAKPVSTATQTALNLKADLNAPVFTGDARAVTPTAGDNDTSIATTAFVTAAVATVSSGFAPINNPVFTGDARAVTPIASDNDTSIATTAFVKAQGYLDATAGNAAYVNVSGDTMTGPLVLPAGSAAATSLNFGFAGYGLYAAGGGNIAIAHGGVAKMTFSGTAILTTDPIVTVQGSAGTPPIQFGSSTAGWYSSGTGIVNSVGKLVTVASATGAAGFNVPHGAAPTTPADGDVWSTTTGLYVRINGTTVGPVGTGGGGSGTPSDANPLVNGTVAPGTSLLYSRGDHVHPIDTSRAPVANPTHTGVVTVPIGSVGTPSIQFGDTDSGIYSTTIAVRLSFNGVDVGGSNVNGIDALRLYAGDGTMTAPGLTFLGGTNQGLYRASSTVWGLTNVGTSVLTFNNTEPTFYGKVFTLASSTATAGLNLGVGLAPTSPVNGDVWTTPTGMYARIAGGTVGPFGVGPSPSNNNPLIDGTAAPGSATAYSRDDHVHPTDTTRLAVSTASTTYVPFGGGAMVGQLMTFPGAVGGPGLAIGATNTGFYTSGGVAHYTNAGVRTISFNAANVDFAVPIKLPASTTTVAPINIGAGSAPTTPVNGDLWSTSAGFYVRYNGFTFQMASLNQDNTFTGFNTFQARVVTAPSGLGTAGFRIPHGVAPGPPTDGDVWTTTSGMYVQVNGSTVGPLGAAGGGPSPYGSNPAMDGTASPGASANYSRGDHVHPTDTSRAASSHTHTASNITDFSTAADARITAAIGVSVQAYDADLTSWGAITPASKLDASAYTAADVLAKLITVDGTGSLLDADFLDGNSSAYYLDNANSTGILPAASFNDTAHGTRAGGTLHAAVTTSVNGFMIAADKVKLDAVPKITVASSAPGSPATNDVWIDTT